MESKLNVDDTALIVTLAGEVKEMKERISEILGQSVIFIDIDKAAQLLNLSKSSLYRFAETGIIPCYKRGRKLYFVEAELTEWIKSGRKTTVAEMLNTAEIKAKRSTERQYIAATKKGSKGCSPQLP